MGKILEAFADDQLHVTPVNEKRTQHHINLIEKAEKLQGRLEETLNDEEKELLKSLVETLFDEGYCDTMDKFIRGYKLGVLMTMEVFTGQETFLGDTEC